MCKKYTIQIFSLFSSASQLLNQNQTFFIFSDICDFPSSFGNMFRFISQFRFFLQLSQLPPPPVCLIFDAVQIDRNP